jgi:hypothetical protein
VRQVSFSGYVIDEQGIHAGPRVQGIRSFSTPTYVRAVHSVLGLTNQYGQFSDRLAEVSQPIHELLQKDVVWMWGDAQERSFHEVK